MFEYTENYMKRALSLAALGRGNTSPNPMVGAVIVHRDRIIGEGYHRRFGEGHAEVNAVNSVCDRDLLHDATMYVTLEPCSHYGKTPPCARLIIDCGIPRVVVGASDPFDKVAGRGIAMLRDAGVEVIEGVLADESRALNARFFTAHTLRRPFVTLKWACSADGFMDWGRTPSEPAARFSNPLTSVLTHRLRSLNDAILTSAATVNADDCRLNVRLWHGRSPRPVIIDRSATINPRAALLSSSPLYYTAMLPGSNHLPDTELPGSPERIAIDGRTTLADILADLYKRGITSVLVEAGPRLLQSFIDMNLWDLARVEISPTILGDRGTHPAPVIPALPADTATIGDNRLVHYTNNTFLTTGRYPDGSSTGIIS